MSEKFIGKAPVSGFYVNMREKLARSGAVKPFGLKTGQGFRVCKLPGACANLNRDFKMESPVNTLPFQNTARIITNDGAACCSGASADDYNQPRGD